MADDEVGYYQILDNYTIWRLETVADVHRVHQTPMRTLSFPSSPFLRAEIKPSFQLHHEVPLHKKRNLAKNLRAMIEDLQQKAERIEAEVSDGDIVTSIIPLRSKPSHSEEIFNSHQDGGKCEVSCEHFNQITMMKKQLEVLSRDKHFLEEQIVRLQLDKSSDQGTDSEKRVSKLETENKLLKEQLKLSIEKISQLNKEKCQEFSSRFSKSFSNIEMTRNWSRELQVKLRKYHECTLNLKEDLDSLKESFLCFQEWGLLQLQQGGIRIKEIKEKKQAIRSNQQPLLNGNFVQNQKDSAQKMEYLNSCEKKRHRETTIVNDSAPSAIEKNSDFGSDCNALKDTTYITFSDKRSTPVMRGSGVLYRIRPLLEKGAKSSIHVTQQVIQVQHRNRNKIFQCEQILQPSQSQEQLFELLKPTIISCLYGTNVCIFLYGETGSGKTYTAEGSVDFKGILSLSVDELMKIITTENKALGLNCSVAELRNEIFRDILNTNSKTNYLETKQSSDGGIMLANWTNVPIQSKNDYEKILARCQTVHKVHNCNMSHIIHNFRVCSSDQETLARLCVIDLAGSERMDKSPHDPIRMKEIQNVTKSLTCLGDVLHAINTKQCHVPYRTTKLTHFLQDYMQSNSKSELVVHLRMNDVNSSETISSLMFGQRTTGADMGQPGSKTPIKSPSRNESHTSTPRPRRPSTGLIMADTRSFIRRSSVSSERSSSKKMAITPQSEGNY